MHVLGKIHQSPTLFQTSLSKFIPMSVCTDSEYILLGCHVLPPRGLICSLELQEGKIVCPPLWDHSHSPPVHCWVKVSHSPDNGNLVHFHWVLWPPGLHGVGNFNLFPFLKATFKCLFAFEAERETVWNSKNRGKMLYYVSFVSGLPFHVFSEVPDKMMHVEMNSHQLHSKMPFLFLVVIF